MRRAYTLLILGIWVAVLPYLGFPSYWKNILFVLSGFGLIYFSYTLYMEAKEKDTGKDIAEKSFDNYSENNGFEEKLKGEGM